ncbi:MAG: PQQ-like beta-propeller repeat protein [Candidatus Saganbacteria bacterium]|nr:PQQ-like beta-propeller repeat protein [Candidatus Saganbacteria bacterium]
MKCNHSLMKLILLLLVGILFLSGCGQGTTSTSSGNINSRLLYSFSQGSAGFYYASPTLVGDYIYIGTSRKFQNAHADDNYFFKLDKSLNKIWEYSLGTMEVRGSAVLDSSGNIYFVVEVGKIPDNAEIATDYLYSLDSSGSFRWRKLIRPPGGMNTTGVFTPAISTNDVIYVGGDKFYAFNSDGTTRWTYGSNMVIRTAPAIDSSGNIYFGAPGSNFTIPAAVYSLTATGAARFVSVVGTINDIHFTSSPAFSTDETKIYIGFNDIVYCFSTTDGSTVWSFTPPGIQGDFNATPAVDQNNNIYFGTKANQGSVFYAIKADGSALLWKNEINADLYCSPCLGNNGIVYVGSEYSGNEQRLHAMNITTGATVWSSYLPYDTTWCSPVLSDEGILYVGTMSELVQGKLYAFQTTSTGLLSNAGSPRFHGGNASTGRRN